ncbi:MAG: glycosyltransferase family 4 protein [Planctomycetota bacterium]
MRIAHVNQDRGIAAHKKKGAWVHVDALRRAFLSLGTDVCALDIPDESELTDALARAHRAAPIGLVYERHALGAFAAGEFTRARGIPHVLEVNAPLALEEELYRRGPSAVEPRERELFAGVQRVLAVSAEVARYVTERGARAECVHVCPNAVDPVQFRPREPNDALRNELVPDGRFALGFHGRLRAWHNFPLLIDAVCLLIDQRVPVHLLVLGEGAFEEHLHDRVPADRVRLLGWQSHDEAARVVACFDAIALTYAADRPFYYSPLKLLEAMAVRAVPVVPRISTLPDAVGDGQRGLVYTAGDPSALAAALRSLAEQPALHERLATNARAYAEQHSWRRIAQDIVEFAAMVRA